MKNKDLNDWVEQSISQIKKKLAHDKWAILILETYRVDILKRARNNVFEVENWKSTLKRKVKNVLLNYSINSTNNLPSLSYGKNASIVFWPWLPMHIGFLKSVYHQFLTTQYQPVFYSNNLELESELSKYDSIKLQFEKYSHYAKILRKSKQRILKESKQIQPFQQKNQTVYLYNILSKAFDLFERFEKTVDAFYIIKDKVSPKIIFVGFDLTIVGRAICLLSKNYSIATTTVQHGSNRTDDLKYSIADFNFVFGPRFKERLDRIKLNNITVKEVGSTKFESYFLPEFQQNIHPDLKDFADSPPFLIALSGVGHSISLQNHELTIECLESMIQHYNTEKFICKLHPKDNKQFYDSLDKYANIEIIDKVHPLYSIDFPEWLKISKALITGASASALEAFILRKPVFSIDPLDEISNTDFIAKGITLHSRNREELIGQIGVVLEKGPQLDQLFSKIDRYVNNNFTYTGKMASAEIVDFLLKKISEKACVE